MKNSLNTKIVLLIVLVISVVIFSFETYNIIINYYHLNKELHLSINIVSNRLSNSLWPLVYEYNREQIDKYLTTEMMNKNIYAIVVTDSIDNSIISGKIRDENWDLINYREKKNLDNYISKKVSIKRINEVIGTVSIFFTKKFIMESFFKYLLTRTISVLILLVIIIITLTISISKIILKPIKDLKDSVEIISKGDLNHTINTITYDEIGGLTKSFDLMRKAILEKVSILDNKNKELKKSIRERVNAEKKIKERENKLINLLENMPIVCFRYDKKGKILSWNKAAEKIYGYSKKEAIGSSVYDLIVTPMTKKDTEFVIKEVFKGKTVEDMEWQDRDKQGKIGYRMGNTFPLKNIEEKVECGVNLTIDITERKKTEQALHQSEYFLEKSQKVTRLGSYVFDIKEGTWISSKTLDEIFGINDNYPKNINGWINIVHPDEKDEMFKYLNNYVIKEHNFFEKEYRIIRYNDQVERWVLGRGELEFDENNNPIKMIGTIQDISDNKLAELALIESEAKYKQLFEVSPESITLLDINGFIINCNSVTLQIHGYNSKKEIIGTDGFKLVAPKDREKVKNDFSNVLEKNSIYNKEVYLLRKNGEEFLGELSANLVRNINGDPVAIIAITEDITARKKFEEERLKQEQVLMQVQKLNALGELAAGIAHEINQPLSGILMSVDNISTKLKNNKFDINHIKQKINNMRDYIDRIKRLIEHVRIFSRDQKYVSSEKFNINDSIKDALSLVKVQYRNHNINIVTELSSDLPNVFGNVYQFEQVILNFLSNSKDSLEKKDRIMNIKDFKKEIKMKTFYNTKNVFFEIKDNGMGISKENIKEIFNPFFTTKDIDRGTGLGLSVSYGIIKEMKGNINIKSEYLIFAKITLSFPREINNNGS